MLFRNRRVAQATACYLLLQITSSLLFPTVSLAMMGPSQPEFVSYDAPGATDMVDLATGDFSYRLPVLDVPGPERSFSLPLAYSAGIQLEQEASWVGLGWTLNPGAIARSVNGYPDDANADQISTTFYKDIQRGWTGGIPGVLDLGWNSISGHSGAVSFLGLQGYTWDEDGISGSETVGITHNYRTGEIKADPAKMAAAAATIASLGTVPPGAVGASIGNRIASTVIGTAAQGSLGGTVGFNNQPIREVSNHAFSQDYWDYYNTSSTESAFGSLWFGNMHANAFNDQNVQDKSSPSFGPDIYATPQATSASKAKLFFYQRQVNQTRSGKKANITYETAADIYQDGSSKTTDDVNQYKINFDGTKYRESGRRPISIAHDNFRVMGENVTGSIRPYRLDVGNVAYPKLGVSLSNLSSYTDYNSIQHYKYQVVPFLSPSAYRPGFRYENSISNGYTYHKYTPTNGNEAVGFNINPTTSSSGTTSLTITDPRLDVAKNTANAANTAIEAARKGLRNTYDNNTYAWDRQLVQGRHVKWYSNRDIINMTRNPGLFPDNSFLEFGTKSTSNTEGYGGNFRFRGPLPPEGIGAFAVTAEDGTTYHYSLPVYQFQTYQEANEVWAPTTIGGLGKSTRQEGLPGLQQTGVSGFPTPSGARATAWLLTAITSADYVDRNNSGTVDASDWGGWVKFDYGQFSSQYKWRQPYIGNSYSDEDNTIKNQGFTEGYKQTYYLNSISTRSHTALFIKSVRQDGRGHFTPAGTASHLGIDERVPASALRLDEVILLDNATLSKLSTAGGINTPADPNQVPALTTATSAQFGPYTDGPMSGAGDIMDNVFDTHDLDGDSRIRKFVEANALKRVRFNYDYDLCREVPNSFTCLPNDPSTLPPMDEAHMATNRSGKLTLKSVSFFGPTINNTPTKIIPDFSFSYEKPAVSVGVTNPAYARDKWDAFGMYNSAGRYDVTSHHSQRSDYAAPWTLTQITDPLGGTTDIAYERDEYAHVSEFGTTRVHLSSTGCSAYTVGLDNNFNGLLTSAIKQGQTIYLTGVISYRQNSANYTKNYKNFPAQVATVTNSQLTLTDNSNPALLFGLPCSTITSTAFDVAVANNVTGGDIRVAAITTKDGTNSYQTRYKYTVAATSENAGFNSAGVLAQEPPFLNRFDQSFYGVADYPVTPVLYSQVSVLSGQFRNDADDDYTTRKVYSFFTPTSGMVQDANPKWKQATPYTNYGLDDKWKIPVVVADNQTIVDIGKVGQLQQVASYNRLGQQELATSFAYSSSIPNADGVPNQGHYTEGVLNNERVESEYRINRSTKEYVPTVMVGSRTTRKGVSTSVNNVLYDFYTGQVLETASTNSLGKVLHSRSLPAYTLPGNASMSAKGDNATNKHMLVQSAASYAYIEVPNAPAYDPLNPLNPATSHVVSAAVQTWKAGWSNYREPDASGTYQDVTGQTPVWRPSATYTWQSPVLDTDGSFKNFAPFNWTGASDSHWQKTGETVRYDHYSHPVEARDMNGNYVAQKQGYDQTKSLVSASNARYTEIAYSGAEDQLTVGSSVQFGGEVLAGGTLVPVTNGPVHTGFYSLQLAAGQKGFLYRAQVGKDIDAAKTYRLNVWTNANASDSKLYVSLNGSRIAASSATTAKKAGAWSLLSLLYTVPSSANGQTLEFGCVNDGTVPTNFDDFRLSPLLATITSRVYDPRTNQVLYSLDNDNLFTRYEYTPTGRLKRVYQEVLDGTSTSASAQKLVKEYEYNYARLYFPTWVSQVYRCQTDAQGNYTGYEERQVIDINPLNQTPTAAKWEPNSYSSNCRNCPPAGTVLDSWCTDEQEQDGRYIYHIYTSTADGNCGTYLDESMGSGSCN